MLIDGIRVPGIAAENAAMAAGVAVGSCEACALPALVWPEVVAGRILEKFRRLTRAPTGGNDARAGATWRSEVRTIRARAAGQAEIMRAGIRLPSGRAAQAVISEENHPDAGGVELAALGRFSTQDATIFSHDVAVHGARTSEFFQMRGAE